jgi:hypothetical protein
MYRSKFITRQLFTDTEEKALADYLITSANMHYGLNINQTKELAYNFALANNKNVPQNWHTNKRASKDWHLYEKYHFGPASVYNVDETGLQTVRLA